MKPVIYIIPLVLSLSASGQEITGRVYGEKDQPLSGVSIHHPSLPKDIQTDNKGRFEISLPESGENKLVFTYEGYHNDTVLISGKRKIDIHLKSINSLGEVLVKGEKQGQFISSINPVKTEIISSKELEKGACCDLAGCFGSNASVQPSTSNVITNAKELRILGLSGVYNQVLLDGFPMIQGLTYTYGVSNIPGPLIDNIYISKGANSVLQGYESISGQVNVETKNPDNADRFFLNLYLNSFSEKQLNAYYTLRKNKWSNLLAVHSVQPANKTDTDNDGFLDLPRITRYELFNKLRYGSENDPGLSSQVGFRYIDEKRFGGQVSFDPGSDKGSGMIYGQSINIRQPEIWSKTAYRFDDSKRLVLFASAYYQEQDDWYGTTHYDARQTTMNTSLQYEWTYNEESNLKAGFSFRHFQLDEDIRFTENPLNHTYAGDYRKSENIPGFYAENTLHFGEDKFTWIAGARLDNHNKFGSFFTPRTLLKYTPFEKTTIRGSAGMGWRTANIFSENSNLLASQRDIIFLEELKPEQAVNYGLSIVQRYESENLTGTVSVDFYHTEFLNQVFPGYNVDPTKVYIGNFTGRSVSDGFQAEASVKLYDRLDIKLAYNFLDVYRINDGSKEILPFNSRHKILNTFSYAPVSDKWHIDMNIHWFGEQVLPDTRTNPAEYQRPGKSDPYTTVNAQFTYKLKQFEIYGGCENIFNFRQLQPIISWEMPFGQYFDVSSAWGPTRGREGYIGLRFKISAD
jgi:outer membrane receptor for ferrienterochelin and colicins